MTMNRNRNLLARIVFPQTNRATACPTQKKKRIAIFFKTGVSYREMSIFPEFSLTLVHEYAELPA
jgi:hypothetical protein